MPLVAEALQNIAAQTNKGQRVNDDDHEDYDDIATRRCEFKLLAGYWGASVVVAIAVLFAKLTLAGLAEAVASRQAWTTRVCGLPFQNSNLTEWHWLF